jgi:hypothetical protein
MDKAQAIALMTMLYAQEIEARTEMVKNAAKEKNIKEGELFKLLKEAGYEPKAPKGTTAPNGADIQQQPDNNTPPNGNQNNNNQNNSDQETKKVTVLASHKTEYDRYRCAGLVLTRKPENYVVTEAQLEKLKCDPWVVLSK